MENLLSFAKTDLGAILGAVLVLVGISSYLIAQKVLIPRLLRKADEPSQKAAKLFHLASQVDFTLFCVIGSVLLYLHFR